MMTVAIMALDEFMKLEPDEQVENLKRYKVDYTLKDIREAWGLKHSAQYYMLLKKLRIYERVVNKSDKFYPEQMLGSSGIEQRAAYQLAVSGADRQREDHFTYQLNMTLDGPELADKLERVAHFLKGETKRISVRLTMAVVDGEEPAAEPAVETAT